MNYQRVANILELASKICAVMSAAAIVLSTAATVVLFPFTALLSLGSGQVHKKFNWLKQNPTALVFMLFCSLLLVGTLYSAAPWPDILLILRKYAKFFWALMFFPLFLEERWRKYAICAFLAAIFILLIASYLREYGWMHYGTNGVVEVFKPSIEFNFLMAFAAYLCLLQLVAAGLSARYRIMWVIFLGFIIYTILFRSVGRSGYFVFAGLVGLFAIQKFHWRGFIVALTSVALLFGLAFAFSLTFRGRINEVVSDIKSYRQNSHTSVGLRLEFVENSLRLIKAHPIFGRGTGSFAGAYAAIKPTPIVLTRNPHNEYLHIMVQFGIVGGVVLLLLFGVPLWYGRLLPEKERYIVYGAIISIMLGSLANSWLLDVTQGHFYAYFMALAFAALDKRKTNKFE